MFEDVDEKMRALKQNAAENKKLRKEIIEQDKLMINGVFLLAFSMFLSFIAAEMTLNVALYKFVYALGMTMVFWIARGDYSIHRIAAYIRSVEGEQQQSGWETAKAKLRSRKLMFFVDIFAASGLLWMLYECHGQMVLLGAERFANIASGCILLGIAFTVLMVTLAQKRW
ncbi:MAG: hypothetical protein JWO40_744 [Candidatus Doudnabacteria bacterium]|nr:hypothetical protein [Candidatus Doudnabacteria bacterium]